MSAEGVAEQLQLGALEQRPTRGLVRVRVRARVRVRVRAAREREREKVGRRAGGGVARARRLAAGSLTTRPLSG